MTLNTNSPTLKIWNVDGTPGAELKGHTGNVISAAWGTSGIVSLAPYDDKQRIRIWRPDGTQQGGFAFAERKP